MLKFRGGFDKMIFDAAGWRREFVETLGEELKAAMAAFVSAAWPLVPVYSGMARAAYRPLGRFVNVAVPIEPVPTALTKHPGMTPDAGELLSSYEFGTTTGGRAFVVLRIDMAHFIENETTAGPHWLKNPAPWQSMQAGRAAFRDYLRKNLKVKIPPIGKFVTRTRVEF